MYLHQGIYLLLITVFNFLTMLVGLGEGPWPVKKAAAISKFSVWTQP